MIHEQTTFGVNKFKMAQDNNGTNRSLFRGKRFSGWKVVDQATTTKVRRSDGHDDSNTIPSLVVLYVLRDRKDYRGRGAQDGHLDFHTAPELWDTTLQSSHLI